MPDQQEIAKWVEDKRREDAIRHHEQNSAFFDKVDEAAIKGADNTLRAALVVNSGAAVAVLAFVGGLISKDAITIEQLSDVAHSLLFFAWGVVAAVAAMGVSYLVHYTTAGRSHSLVKQWEHPYVVDGPHTWKWAWTRNTLHGLAVLLAIASVVLFVWGMFDVRDAIIRLGA